MGYKWGIDGYSRYKEDDDGMRYQIEPYPFWRPFSPTVLWFHIQMRLDVILWFWHTRQHRDWWKY